MRLRHDHTTALSPTNAARHTEAYKCDECGRAIAMGRDLPELHRLLSEGHCEPVPMVPALTLQARPIAGDLADCCCWFYTMLGKICGNMLKTNGTCNSSGSSEGARSAVDVSAWATRRELVPIPAAYKSPERPLNMHGYSTVER